MSSNEKQTFEFRLPDPGEGLTEAEIIEWYYDEDDAVQEDAPLVDVETDKAVVEIPTPCMGILEEIIVQPGDIVQVGDVIAVFQTENQPYQQENTFSDSREESKAKANEELKDSVERVAEESTNAEKE